MAAGDFAARMGAGANYFIYDWLGFGVEVGYSDRPPVDDRLRVRGARLRRRPRISVLRGELLTGSGAAARAAAPHAQPLPARFARPRRSPSLRAAKPRYVAFGTVVGASISRRLTSASPAVRFSWPFGRHEDVVLDAHAQAAVLGGDLGVGGDVEARLDREHHAGHERTRDALLRVEGRRRARPCPASGWCGACRRAGRRPSRRAWRRRRRP